jgi:hypothetical protein
MKTAKAATNVENIQGMGSALKDNYAVVRLQEWKPQVVIFRARHSSLPPKLSFRSPWFYTTSRKFLESPNTFFPDTAQVDYNPHPTSAARNQFCSVVHDTRNTHDHCKWKKGTCYEHRGRRPIFSMGHLLRNATPNMTSGLSALTAFTTSQPLNNFVIDYTAVYPIYENCPYPSGRLLRHIWSCEATVVLTKIINEGKGWNEHLHGVLWADRSTVRGRPAISVLSELRQRTCSAYRPPSPGKNKGSPQPLGSGPTVLLLFHPAASWAAILMSSPPGLYGPHCNWPSLVARSVEYEGFPPVMAPVVTFAGLHWPGLTACRVLPSWHLACWALRGCLSRSSLFDEVWLESEAIGPRTFPPGPEPRFTGSLQRLHAQRAHMGGHSFLLCHPVSERNSPPGSFSPSQLPLHHAHRLSHYLFI